MIFSVWLKTGSNPADFNRFDKFSFIYSSILDSRRENHILSRCLTIRQTKYGEDEKDYWCRALPKNHLLFHKVGADENQGVEINFNF